MQNKMDEKTAFNKIKIERQNNDNLKRALNLN